MFLQDFDVLYFQTRYHRLLIGRCHLCAVFVSVCALSECLRAYGCRLRVTAGACLPCSIENDRLVCSLIASDICFSSFKMPCKQAVLSTMFLAIVSSVALLLLDWVFMVAVALTGTVTVTEFPPLRLELLAASRPRKSDGTT